jgi:hypothetical protein
MSARRLWLCNGAETRTEWWWPRLSLIPQVPNQTDGLNQRLQAELNNTTVGGTQYGLRHTQDPRQAVRYNTEHAPVMNSRSF